MKQRLSACTSVVELPVTAQRIVDATKKDVTIAKVYVPDCSADGALYAYRSRKDELSLKMKMVVFSGGHRVIVPPVFREQILHAMHPGMVRMKLVA